jgi:hypothetical protein
MFHCTRKPQAACSKRRHNQIALFNWEQIPRLLASRGYETPLDRERSRSEARSEAHPVGVREGAAKTCATDASKRWWCVMDAHARPACRTCHRVVDAGSGVGLRRGLCRACYLRAWRGTELPESASCVLCPEQRRVVLRWTRIGGSKVVTCQNCGFLADRARPKPRSVDELKERLARERRLADRRRNYVIDPLDPAERRVRPRRVRRRA